MGQPIKIFIVEDEMIIAANISLQLTNLGYEITGIVPRGEVALAHVEENMPDIILLDINLKGKIDGIETAELIQEKYNIPIIYLTANTDDTHFKRAKATKPSAFISKPFKKLDLQHAIELAADHAMGDEITNSAFSKKEFKPMVLSDRIFVKNHDRMVKLILADILYFEADRNYCKIFTKKDEYLLVTTLKGIEQKLPSSHFVRIHRSYLVNISQIDEVANNYVVISKKTIPISKSSKSELLNRLQTI